MRARAGRGHDALLEPLQRLVGQPASRVAWPRIRRGLVFDTVAIAVRAQQGARDGLVARRPLQGEHGGLHRGAAHVARSRVFPPLAWVRHAFDADKSPPTRP